MGTERRAALDLDHVVAGDGRIYRVVGNLDSETHFLGYNVYSPDTTGDRVYRGARYRKNFVEDERLPADVLDVYMLLPIASVVEHLDPIASAVEKAETFQQTIWYELYTELVAALGKGSVGIFGSSMLGLHLTPAGAVRKDVDFVIEGLANLDVLRKELPGIRGRLGFTVVSPERQRLQYERYRRVFRNENNSIEAVIARRWTGLQLSPDVVTTIRFRDPSHVTPVALVAARPDMEEAIVSGRVLNAAGSNLFPRKFDLTTDYGMVEIYIFWWKFSTPVRDGDSVTLRGSIFTNGERPVVRLSNYSRHWLRIEE
ncbi:hypothetical protein [Pseudofrankia inefficax]|uniref:Uncharacterized protein n=1 Tax=Pseudofrankia inefficax (strain DSM 45817 / CECT 9037 / DDB 130130 / EuI1c) TaxID=298654 RepID=E3J8U3_PSEI1|nr:hypothetical protein [Pseudofrankia inefficax]ADP79676.1 hypothetical protein FraEuI1c_1618 [Pseudofrankia inefficax]